MGRELKHRLVQGHAAVVGQAFKGQPFETRMRLQPSMHPLGSRQTLGAVKTRGPWGGHQAVRAGTDLDAYVQCVAPDQPAGGVNQHVVTNAMAFGIKRLKDAQWPFMPMAYHASF
jgi:hypothetical protein